MNPEIITDRARELRRNQTRAESLVWKHLRNRQIHNLKFKRQYPIVPYFVDFFCEEHNLIVEIDGGQHSPGTDKKRTDYLTGKGYKILRFWNNEVLENIEGVVIALAAAVSRREIAA